MALRIDQDSEGHISIRENITSVFPFPEHGIDMDGVRRILDDAGLGLPSYYEWHTRSGCYLCFFHRKSEWVRLAERHPELFETAAALEQKVAHQATR